MDWQALAASMPSDRDLPARAARNLALTAVLQGKHYDHLPHAFATEYTPGGEYVPFERRRPSVRSGLCRTVVDDSVALLFSEGHFPPFHGGNKQATAALNAWVKERRLNETFADAATRGSVGSVALLFRVLKGKPFLSVLPTAYLTPTWEPEDPDTLATVAERYKVGGQELRGQGYTIPDDKVSEKFWFQRVWTATEEAWFLPLSVSEARDGKQPVRDDDRSVTHGLGFLPVVWIRNLPGGDEVDGGCTFEAAVGTTIEVDYQLSQAGRALKYASDPKLVIRDPAGGGVPQGEEGAGSKPVVGGAANALVLSSPESEAKFLEINGTAASAVLEHARFLRSVALESVHGNRADAEKLAAAQSGRAMELMCQPLVWLADHLRTSYGEGALLAVARMFCAASTKVSGGLLVAGQRYRDLSADGLALSWPAWFAPTAEDRQAQATTLRALVAGGVLSEQTATRIVADSYDVEDVPAERALIQVEKDAADQRLANQAGVQTKASETLPA